MKFKQGGLDGVIITIVDCMLKPYEVKPHRQTIFINNQFYRVFFKSYTENVTQPSTKEKKIQIRLNAGNTRNEKLFFTFSLLSIY